MRLASIALVMLPLAATSATAAQPPAHISGPASVTDGDTFDIGSVVIRLHGIDAPEAGQSCERRDGSRWDCGTQAANVLAGLVEGKDVDCEALDRDPYNRIVARCTAGGRDVNTEMIRAGYAFAFIRYSADFVPEEREARAKGVGIWSGKVEAPWEYRADRWERAAAAAPRKGCPIKGNIAKDGTRIYHTPWSPWYSRTKISTTKGERWFCDEAEALKAGWRAAQWH